MSLRTAGGPLFRLASDGVIPTWSSRGWARWFDADLAAEIAKDADDFHRVASTIGGYILFPRNSIGQAGSTINQARGVDRRIADRFDLTLECIRLHYSDPSAYNPLGERLAYYADFFALFGDFDGFVRLFLLDDLVTADRSAVLSFMSGEPVSGFSMSALAVDPAQYAEYRRRSLAFVKERTHGFASSASHRTPAMQHGCAASAKQRRTPATSDRRSPRGGDDGGELR